ncbi:MAG: sensor histidine kinase [Cyclobacteriaceae bacterium]
MNKKKLYWTLQISGWTLFAIINIFFIAILDGIYLSQIIGYFLVSAFFLFSTHLLRYFIKRGNWFKQVFSRILSKVLLAVVVLTLSNFAFTYLITYSSGVSFANILLNIITTFITYLIWIILYFAYHFVDSYNTSLKYEAVKNEIELNKLKSQLNPHFIFNALNSIRALVDEDPGKCKNAITQLSNILRNSLIMDKKRVTDFEEEIQTVRDYLALETIRFEERLQSHIKLHPESERFKVPPLMIQTLVENGIKHGISHLKDGGIISIETLVDKNYMTILIRNSGHYINGKSQEGYGISNTKQRLNLLYGNQSSFRIFNAKENIVITEVKIPRYA